MKDLKEYNTKLLMRVASFMAKNGIVDIDYNQLQEIIECLEEDTILAKQELPETISPLGKTAPDFDINDLIGKELNKDYAKVVGGEQ